MDDYELFFIIKNSKTLKILKKISPFVWQYIPYRLNLQIGLTVRRCWSQCFAFKKILSGSTLEKRRRETPKRRPIVPKMLTTHQIYLRLNEYITQLLWKQVQFERCINRIGFFLHWFFFEYLMTIFACTHIAMVLRNALQVANSIQIH